MLQTIFNRRSLFITSLLLCSSSLFAQVTIQDKISISPKPPTLVQASTSSGGHTLRFEAVWDIPIFARMFTLRNLNDFAQCSGRTDTGTSAMTYETPLSSGQYQFDFQPRVAELQPNQVCNVSLTVRVDGQMVMQASSSFVGGGLDIFALWPGRPPTYTSPYNTTFSFSVGDSMVYEEGVQPSIGGVNTCDVGTWDPASSVNLQITSGTSYAQFYDFNTRLPLGTSVSGTVTQIQNNYDLVADGTIPDSTGAMVTVQATSGGITQTASVKIKPYFFKVWVDSPRVDYGSGTAIRIQMVDVYGKEHYRAATPSVRIRIADSLTYGTLWYGYSDSSRVLQMADTLTNIPSIVTEDPFSGVEARFYAIEEQPKDSVNVPIAVEKTGEGFMTDYYPPSAIPFPGRDTVRGATKLTVITPVTKHLKIVDHSPWEIWPNLWTSSKGLKNYSPQRGFTIQVADESGKALTGDSVRIRSEFESLSGGHNHNNPVLESNLQGKFYAKTMKGNPLTLATDANGKVIIDSLLASEISGQYLIRACLASDTTVNDTVNLNVKVPHLLLFSGTGKYKPTGKTNAHPDNHYFVSQAAIDSLISAANAFADLDWNTTGIMRLNDMSLIWGGLFDLDSGWTSTKGHDSHRLGKSVDIENLDLEKIRTVSIYTQKDTTFSIPKVKWVEKFQDFMQNEMKLWKFVDEHQADTDVFKRTRKYAHFEWKGN